MLCCVVIGILIIVCRNSDAVACLALGRLTTCADTSEVHRCPIRDGNLFAVIHVADVHRHCIATCSYLRGYITSGGTRRINVIGLERKGTARDSVRNAHACSCSVGVDGNRVLDRRYAVGISLLTRFEELTVLLDARIITRGHVYVYGKVIIKLYLIRI